MRKSLIKMTTVLLTATTLFTSVGSITVQTVNAQDDEVIATIGETSITKDQFYEAMKNLSGNVTLRTMIIEEVLLQNVEDVESHQVAAEEEVQAQIEQAGGEETFQQLLDYQQLGTIEEFTHQIFISSMFQEVVENHIDMSDEAITSYYENDYQPTMEAQHILVETEEEANAVLERLNNGEEFDAVAQEVSLDTTAQNGGLLSPFTSGQMVPEFEEAVKNGENDQVIQEPVQSQYGFHVIKVLDNGAKEPLEDIRPEVEEQYVTSKFADSQFAYGVIGRLIQDAGLEINDEDLQNAVDDLIALAEQPASSESAASEESASAEEPAAEGEESATEEETQEEPASESAE